MKSLSLVKPQELVLFLVEAIVNAKIAGPKTELMIFEMAMQAAEKLSINDQLRVLLSMRHPLLRYTSKYVFLLKLRSCS